MKELIQWLRALEHRAGEVYLQAATVYAHDSVLEKFLGHIAEEESWHSHVMGSALDFMASEPELTPLITIDKPTSDRIHQYFIDMENGLKEQRLPRNELIHKIVEVELSEWNDIFLYVVNTLKNMTPEFKYPATRIQAHIKEVEYFLETVENRPDDLKKIYDLPPVWVENILIVDDEPMIANLIKALLNRSGNIDIAHNGRDALALMKKKYYKLIITDISMPLMDGVTFYREAVAGIPKSTNRFLFMTGNLSFEHAAFFDEHHLKHLEKPMQIDKLREAAKTIILS